MHERSKDMDFLFIVIRKLLSNSPVKPKIKIILMSATIQAKQFSDYFKIPKGGEFVSAPIINVNKPSLFSVSTFYFEEIAGILPHYKVSNISPPQHKPDD